jgi:hypothetical protein
MRPSLRTRRPSAPMVISLLALFVALGGVGWAAIQLPADSVGNDQLQNASVSNWKILDGAVANHKLAFSSVGPRKIIDGAVGTNQINSSQVQARVAGSCLVSGGAIGSIDAAGNVQCVTAPQKEFDTSASAVPLGSGSTRIASELLPSGSSYLVFADPHATVTGTVAGQQVEVDCTLTVTPSNGATQTSSAIVEIGPQKHPLAATIPLLVPAPAAANGATASVTCAVVYSGATAPKVAVSSPINAIQTASNTTAKATSTTPAGTSTTPKGQ